MINALNALNAMIDMLIAIVLNEQYAYDECTTLMITIVLCRMLHSISEALRLYRAGAPWPMSGTCPLPIVW